MNAVCPAYLLELLDGTRVDTTALVDQVTGGGRLAGIDVADNDDVNVSLVVLTMERVSTMGIEIVDDGRGVTNPMVTVKKNRCL